jgi:hypothetical protein
MPKDKLPSYIDPPKANLNLRISKGKMVTAGKHLSVYNHAWKVLQKE